MLGVLFLLLNAAALDCDALAGEINQPVPVVIASVEARDLSDNASARPTALDVRPESEIGDLLYRGYGISMRSSDQRFDAIAVAPDATFHHRCGYAAVTPSGWNAFDDDLARQNIRFEAQIERAQVAPGALAADEAGARPYLAGATPGPTWPIWSRAGRLFLGVMQLGGERDRSVIVAFADRHGSVPARVLATLNMRVQGLSVTPDLHEDWSHLNISGRSPDGSLQQVVLALSGRDRDRIAEDLSH